MVNKIDGNNYYDYQKLKNVNIPDASEKFSLDYKQNELQSDSKKSKDKADKSSAEQNQSADEGGVRLELSRQGQTASSARTGPLNADKTQTVPDIRSIIDTVRTFISTAVEAVKDFFYKVWNDPQPEEMQASEDGADFAQTLGSVQTEELSEQSGVAETMEPADTSEAMGMSDSVNTDARTAYRMDTENRDREIQKYLHSGDLNQVMSLLTDDGRKTIARNSSLLTYYDKNGRMVEPNASDRERILHGDTNTKKL